LTRVAALRTQLGVLPPGIDRFVPRPESSILALSQPVAALREDAGDHVSLTARHAIAERGAAASRRAAHEPIAIVGMGAMFPDAPDLKAFWRLLRTGHDAVV